MTEKPANPNEKPLESWKEIAAYLKRDVRTVIRWEKSEGLPVHRHVHHARSSVYAYPSELNAWWAKRCPEEQPVRQQLWWRRRARVLAFAAMLLLTLALASDSRLLRLPSIRAQSGTGMVARQVWVVGRAVEPTGGVSHDGKYLTCVDWETGDLAVHDLATGQDRHLTHKGSWSDSSEFAYFSTPSPDGKQIAYAWLNKEAAWELRLIGLDGSTPRTVFRNEEVVYLQPFEWSRDGKNILARFPRKDNTNQIVLVSVADGSVRVVKTLDWRYPLKMSISPDGRFIVYDFPPRENSPNRDIFLLATDGSQEIPLVQHPANDLFPVWTPDGSRVLFVSDRTGSTALWTLSLAEGKPLGPPRLLKPDVGRIFPLGFTDKGSFYYGLSTGMIDVYLAEVDLATGTVLSPPVSVAQRYVGSNTSSDWSPDGKFIAYLSERGPMPGEGISSTLVIRSLATGEERELVPQLTRFKQPRWSPDGRSITVAGRDAKGREGLYLVDVQTGKTTQLIVSPPGTTNIETPAWAPDGKSIWYRTYGAKGDRLLRHDFQTGQDIDVLPKASGLSNLAVSPDGQWLAFSWSGGPASRLLVMPTAGGEPRELLRVSLFELIPANGAVTWTPDGQQLLFIKWKFPLIDRPAEIWRVSAQGSEDKPLGLTMERPGKLRVHPDGRHIAFSAGQRKVEIWAMENLLPALKGAR